MKLTVRLVLAFWLLYTIGFLIGLVLFSGTAWAGTAPEADLTAPIPLCEEMEAALALPPEDFAGLHPDAFAQFQAMVADLCQPRPALPDDVLLARVFNGHRIPPAAIPLPPTLLLLTAAIAALALKRKHHD